MRTRRLSWAQIRRFRETIYARHARHRRNLPWRTRLPAGPLRRSSSEASRQAHVPYHILVSEIMLQQTQVDRAVPKYRAFLRAFPNFSALARAPLKQVLLAWQGLGYNRRALALRRIAQAVVRDHGGILPRSHSELEALPGIGPYTASAIRVFAWNQPDALIETNIRSVFIHHFFKNRRRVPDAALLPFIGATLDRAHPCRWYEALMDYGSDLKGRVPNPNRRSADHVRQSRFEGSTRQLRGLLLRDIAKRPAALEKDLLAKILADRRAQARRALATLERDGFIKRTARGYAVCR